MVKIFYKIYEIWSESLPDSENVVWAWSLFDNTEKIDDMSMGGYL